MTSPDHSQLDGYFRFPELCEELVQLAAEEQRKRAEFLKPREQAGRPRSIPSLLRPYGVYRQYDHFKNGNSILPRHIAENIFYKAIGPLVGFDKEDEYFTSYNAYFTVSMFLNARHHGFRPPNTIDAKRSENIINELLFPISMLEKCLKDRIAFYDIVSAEVEAYASSDQQRNAISLAFALCRYIEGKFTSSGGFLSDQEGFAYCSQIARLGGWAAQQVGQRRWLSYFIKRLENYKTSGDRVATVSYYMLEHHMVIDDYHLSGVPPLQNMAALAHHSFRQLPAGVLGHIQEQDATLYGNPATFQVLMGHGIEAIVDDGNGKTVQYALEKALDLDSQNEFDPMGKLSHVALLVRAHANSGNFCHAEELRLQGYDILSSERSRVSTYAVRNMLVASGELEGIRTGNFHNKHLIEARDVCLEMGNIYRAIALERRMGMRK